MKVVVNIGLNVGSHEPKTQLSNTLKQLANFELTNLRIEDDGEYKGDGERTLIAYFEIYYYNNLFETICWMLNQEAIAYKLDGEGHIAFNPWYKGEKFPFDQKYFKD
jgi:hypothetical protein